MVSLPYDLAVLTLYFRERLPYNAPRGPFVCKAWSGNVTNSPDIS